MNFNNENCVVYVLCDYDGLFSSLDISDFKKYSFNLNTFYWRFCLACVGCKPKHVRFDLLNVFKSDVTGDICYISSKAMLIFGTKRLRDIPFERDGVYFVHLVTVK